MRITAAPNIDIHIRVNNVDLPEYDLVDVYPIPDAFKYIESVAGATFEVRLSANSLPAPSPCKDGYLEMKVYLDGTYAAGFLLRHGPYARQHDLAGKEYQDKNGTTNLQKFSFAHLKTKETCTVGDAHLVRTDLLKKLGTVEVKCTWVDNAGPGTDYGHTGSASDSSLLGSGIPEKLLKGRAISNHATLAAPEVATRRLGPPISVTWPFGREPFATYMFYYRSHKDLQIEGIIPRSPSPVPLEQRDPGDLTTDELRQLVREAREREAQRARLKREQTTMDGNTKDESITGRDANVQAERGRSAKRTRTSGSEPGSNSGSGATREIETIDLTV